jgi:glutathione S-transferase
MPVLKDGETVVKGSANIVDYLEQQFPERPLYPTDASARTRALELQTWFDDAGVHLRRAFFRDALEDAGYMADRFSTGQPEALRTVYRATFPVTRQIMKLDMLITQRGADEGLRRTQEALDIVMKNRGSQDYLVDGRFTVADLCAATILHPVVLPEEYPVQFPQPRPPGVERWLARWAAHPAAEWVREIYRRHRGASHATQDLNL